MKLKKIFRSISLIITAGILLTLFNNMNYFAHNNQRFDLRAFGPSIRSEDGKSIFNIKRRNGRVQLAHEYFWRKIRTKMNAIKLNVLFLKNTDSKSAKIALNDDQLKGLGKVLHDHNMDLVVSASLGLGQVCKTNYTKRRLWKVAKAAVDDDMEIYSRLVQNGNNIKIKEINLDGPFLKLLAGSRKAFGCHKQENKQGFGYYQTADIVGRYISRIQRALKEQQGFKPEVNLVINLPNWEIGGEDEIAWGANGEEQSLRLATMLRVFKHSRTYGTINRVVIDYPFHFVSRVPHAPRIFKNKISALYNEVQGIRGRPQLGVMVNDDMSIYHLIARYSKSNGSESVRMTKALACLERGNVRLPLLTYYGNKCLDNPKWTVSKARLKAELKRTDEPSRIVALNALIKHGFPKNKRAEVERAMRINSRAYNRATRDYYNLVKHGLPRNVNVDSVFMQSWQDMPRKMKVWGTYLTNIM